jgi:hypothetical protein
LNIPERSLLESFREYLRTVGRVLTFRASRDELLFDDPRVLYFGLLTTWIVGIGRFWDNPDDAFYRHLGIGSVVYVFVLSLIIFIFVFPFKVPNFNYRRVLTFITMTSPPGLLYAIPVRTLWGADLGSGIYLKFLGVVAVWRVSLLFFYLSRFCLLNKFNRFVTAFLPLSLIITTLAILNLDKVVFDIMDGDFGSPSVHNYSYAIEVYLANLSILFFGPLLVSYIGSLWYRSHLRAKSLKARE